MTLSKVWVTHHDAGRPDGWGRSETAGRKFPPWEITMALDTAGFPGTAPELAEFVATVLAESNGYALARLVYTDVRGVPLGWDDQPVDVVAFKTPSPDEKVSPMSYDRSVRWQSDRGPFQFSAESVTDKQAADLDTAARLAVEYWRRRGLQPWMAHSSGRYKPRMREATKGVANYLAKRYEFRPFWC